MLLLVGVVHHSMFVVVVSVDRIGLIWSALAMDLQCYDTHQFRISLIITQIILGERLEHSYFSFNAVLLH